MIEEQGYIAKVKAVIEANYQRDDFGVHELVKALNISRSQLHRKIKSACGISASAYINEFRLKKALLLLQQGSMTVSEVAYEVGFSSPSYFSTSFKKYYSYSPGQVIIRQSDVLSPSEKTDGDEQEEYHQYEGIKHKRPTNKILHKVLIFSIGAAGLLIASYFILKASGPEAIQDIKTAQKEKSIAVLPFRNYSDDVSMDAFCFGMTDELISKLSKIKDFDRVISRTSTFKFKDMNLSIPEIASELGVTYILEGNIQKADGAIRVNLRLIDAEKDDHVWTDYYSGNWESRDILIIQEKATAFIANAMQIALMQNESGADYKNITPNKEAYDLYVQAKFQNFSSDEASMENAKQMLIKAVSLDTTFAPAFSDLGLIWSLSGLEEGIKNQDVAWEKGAYYLNKAQQLDPTMINNELYLLQGYFFYDWDFERLEKFYHARFSTCTYDRNSIGLVDYAVKTGRFESALTAINKSIEADPLDPVLFAFKARLLWFLGKREEGLAILDQIGALNENDWLFLREAAHNYFMMKEYEHSRQILDLLYEKFEDRSPFLLWLKLNYASMDRNNELVNSLYHVMLESYNNGDSGSPAWFIALYHLAIIKDKEKAFEWLEKSFARKEVELTWLKQEPMLEPIRNDKRYLSLYGRIGFNKLTLK